MLNEGQIGAWEIEQQRVTLFFAPGFRVDAESIWADLEHAQPQNVSKQPSSGTVAVVGVFGGNQLIIQSSPNRVDFVVSGAPDELGIQPEGIGPLKRNNTFFLDKIIEWIPGKRLEIIRLAFGANLFWTEKNSIDCYKRLAQFLPSVNIDIEKSRDLVYQINRPRYASSFNVEINRVSKWSSQKKVYGTFSVEQGGQLSTVPVTETLRAFLEMDINTSADNHSLINIEVLPVLLQELKNATVEIAEHGDQK